MDDALLWVDLETTGLNPQTDSILEAGFILTDMQFNELEDTCFFVYNPHDPHIKEKMDAFVLNMHTNNFLFEDAHRNTSGFATTRLPYVLGDFIAYCKKKYEIKNLHWAGSSLHFDTEFLDTHNCYPLVRREFHHRRLDASSVRMILQSQMGFDPEVPKVQPEHRPLSDIRSSILLIKSVVFPVVEAAKFAEHTLKVMEARQNEE